MFHFYNIYFLQRRILLNSKLDAKLICFSVKSNDFSVKVAIYLKIVRKIISKIIN